jgi:4-amino-4-deoxy-L-arabinose transferase-like glycosyltransferase
MALYPYLLYLAGVFTTQNQVILLLLLFVYCLYRRQDGGGRRWLIGGGLALGGAGCFMVPVFATAPVLGVWHALRMSPKDDVLNRRLLNLVNTTSRRF